MAGSAASRPLMNSLWRVCDDPGQRSAVVHLRIDLKTQLQIVRKANKYDLFRQLPRLRVGKAESYHTI